MVILHQAPDDFRILVRRGIGMLLAGKRNQQGRVILVGDRRPVPAVPTRHLHLGPFGPQVQAGGRFHQLRDVRPADAPDTWNLWDVLYRVILPLKDTILARAGKVVIRPDSGDPVKIVTGDSEGATEAERKGVVEILWDIFGGHVNAEGYKVLDPHIGCIYGDAITRTRASDICSRLKAKGFASTNMVFGIGSYTYQYNTRDTFGYAMKSTLCVINGEEIQIFKDPVTDNGVKKSAKGAVRVYRTKGPEGSGVDVLAYQDELTLDESNANTLLQDVFVDGKLLVDETFADIKARVLDSLKEKAI